jgi:quercetin dioxygenase-like cupin family protein
MKTPCNALIATFCVTVTAVMLTGVTTVVLAGAQSAARNSVTRALFDHHDQSAVPGKEIVTGTAELPAGTAIGWHVHAGDEAGYVLRGNLVLKTRGQPDRLLEAGDFFFNPRGAVHSLEAAPGSKGGTAYSTWIVDKDKPLVEMVP